MYKEPKTPDATFVDHFDKLLSTYCSQYTNAVLCGDINVNMLKNNSISDIIDVHGMKDIVTKPICVKSETPTLIDVVFTTVPKRFKHVCCIECDFHQMVCFSTKFDDPRHINKVSTYRSYKNFNREQFLCDSSSAPFHVAQVFDTAYTWLDCCCSTQHKLYSPPCSPQWGPVSIVFWAGRPSGPSVWLALLLLKAGDVETNPGPKHTRLDLRYLPQRNQQEADIAKVQPLGALGAPKMLTYPRRTIHRHMDMPST